MNLKNILFKELISIEKEQVKLLNLKDKSSYRKKANYN